MEYGRSEKGGCYRVLDIVRSFGIKGSRGREAMERG